LDRGEVTVKRIQQDIPFSRYRRGRNEHGSRLAVVNPVIAKSPQGFVSRFMPTVRKILGIECANFDRIRNLAFDKNEICWSQIRFEIYEGFDRGER
jgi:hypothetical protein